MTAVDPDPGPDTGGLTALPGLEMAAGQLAPLITVLRAEQARRKAGIAISRPAWKNLVFTGGPGTGKSRAATAIARLYRDLGVLQLRQPDRDPRRRPGRHHPPGHRDADT